MKLEVEGKEVQKKTVTASGTSGHVYLPKMWIGKKVVVVLLEE